MVDEARIKMMKEAKTGDEMIDSWRGPGAPPTTGPEKEVFRPYIDRRPEMIETFIQRPMIEMAEREIFDPKTRALIHLAILIALPGAPSGIILHTGMALKLGCTEEEIMEVAYMVVAARTKSVGMASIGPILEEGFRAAEKMK